MSRNGDHMPPVHFILTRFQLVHQIHALDLNGWETSCDWAKQIELRLDAVAS